MNTKKRRTGRERARTISTTGAVMIMAITTAAVIKIGISESAEGGDIVSDKAIQAAINIPEPVKYIDMDVPSGNTYFKSYMNYLCITNTDSLQYKMQQTAYTDGDGLRRYKNGDYMIALGSYYGNVGDRFRITLDSGRSIMCIMGDIKADAHTDVNNQYVLMDDDLKNVVEFIVDTDTLDDFSRIMGDVSYCDMYCTRYLMGNISKIEKMVE